jgi:hypothetical protein
LLVLKDLLINNPDLLQFANFDKEWPWDKSCTTKADPTNSNSNQFKCCHDWLGNSFSGVNAVSIVFLKPTEILHPSTCAANVCTEKGVWVGMPGAIDYFSQAMNLVFVSIGGATYTASWEEALQINATEENFAKKVADNMTMYNVGVEIDYEESASPLLLQLETFIRKYRDMHPFEPWDQNPSPPSFHTLDFGQGAQFMGPMANWVAHKAFKPSLHLLSWANAMVSGGQESRVSDLIARWWQHIYGYSTI